MIGPRKVDKPLVLYGYGKLGRLAKEIFGEIGIPIASIFDRTTNTPPGWTIEPQKSLLAICVATESYEQVIAPLKAVGWTDVVPVFDIIEAYPEVGIHNGFFADPLTHEDRDGMTQVAIGLPDKISRSHYYAHLEWRRYREELAYEVEPMESLPSTLADIRGVPLSRLMPGRQRVDIYYDYPMSSVYIHEEGCELKTLEVNMALFQKHRPVISCACYHSRDGLWKIEKFLMDNLHDYTWTFRLTAFMGQGAYIYGTPNDGGSNSPRSPGAIAGRPQLNEGGIIL